MPRITPDAAFFASLASRLRSKISDVDSGESAFSCVTEAAQALANEVFAAAHIVVAQTPHEDLPVLGKKLDADAAVIGCQFASLIRQSVPPYLAALSPWSDAELHGAQAYWAELRRLDDTFGIAAGSA